MLKHFPLLGLLGSILLFAGCSSRQRPDLYRPGDIPTWRTVDTAVDTATRAQGPVVVLNTSRGTIAIELYEDRAPVSVRNFLRYVDEGFYDGTIFHRVIPGFMVQGGGFTPGMEEKQTYGAISNESGNGLPNRRGTVAMARTAELDSATAQFFINLVDNAFLNGGSTGDGYAVFGRVIEGMNVVDEIATVPTGSVGSFDDVPRQPVRIESARRR